MLRPLCGVLCLLALFPGCAAQAPLPDPQRSDLRLGEEVFRMFCMRIARDEFPENPDGAPFVAACDGSGALPAALRARRLPALVARRPQIVAALDQVFAEADGQTVPAVSSFAENELRGFLASLIPYYDDETLPRSTRALADVASKLLDRADARGQQVIDTFARLSTRSGYRASGAGLGLVRPLLSYPRIDPLSQQLLGFVAEGGAGHEVFLELLRAAALELAEPAETVADVEQSTLRLVTDLLLGEDASFASRADPAQHYVRRDDHGDALLQTPDPSPGAPFGRYGRTDAAARDADGRALVAPGGALAHRYGDANRTLLAALLRDQKALFERKAPDAISSVEKLLRGARPLLGASAARKHTFTLRAADPATQRSGVTGELAFQGLDIEHSPLLDVVHAFAQLLRYPETDRLLAALLELLEQNESAAAAALYAGLAVDRRADNHPTAQLTGADGEPGTPQEFWDDVIALGMRIAERPGMFRDVVAALTTSEESTAQARLIARFMGFKDEITYTRAPLRAGSDGLYSPADAAALNSLVSHELAVPVERVPGGDVGMNRSLFQRLLSTIRVTNGATNCNKQGARLAASDPATGTHLTFPDPTARPPQCGGDPICDATAATAYSAIDLLCPFAGVPTESFEKCAFIRQPNGAEFFMRSFIGKAQVQLKDEQLNCLVESGLAGDPGETQATSSQLDGFTLNPSTPSITRFLYAPRNAWLIDLFDPLRTIDGAALTDYEPNLLFALEVKDSATTLSGRPLSLLDASKQLAAAFDRHETFESTPDGPLSRGGYLFADLFSVLHMHWGSRRAGGCPRDDAEPACAALSLTGQACSAGCTQSLDPARPFYAKQSNLVSYEPLLIEAFADERLADLLAVAARALAALRIECEDGVTRDGLTILGDFLERALTPDPDIAAYGNKRKFTKTNTCTGETFDSAAGTGGCGCPSGSQPEDPGDPASACLLPDGTIVARGRVLPQATPLHLVLDALRRIDEAFAESAWQDRLSPWRDARSALVDVFLTVAKTPAASAPDDPTKATYALSNPRSRALGVRLLSFVRGRIASYRARGGQELARWAAGLPDRLGRVLAHPLLARGLDLHDQLWTELGAGGPADELVGVASFLLDPAESERFAGVALSAVDTLHAVDRDRALSPAIQFAALLLAENAFTSLDSLAGAVQPPSTETGTAQCALELTRKVADLQRGKPTASALARLLKNAVLPDPGQQDTAPLEILINAIADVNRADPGLPTSTAHSAADVRAVFEQLQSFLRDPDRGLERLYSVIGARTVH